MSVAQIVKRVERVEQALGSRSDPDKSTFTLEELYRSLWQRDRAKFLEIAQQGMLLLPQFEREDALAASGEDKFRSSNSQAKSRSGSVSNRRSEHQNQRSGHEA